MLHQISGTIASRLPNVRIRRTIPENLHLTLRFIAKADDSDVSELSKVLDEAAANAHRFELYVKGLGVFRHRSGSTLWAGVSERENEMSFPTLLHLAREIGGSVQGNFVPHITVGRCKAVVSAVPAQIDLAVMRFDVGEVVLFESFLRRTGAEYKVISRHPLRG